VTGEDGDSGVATAAAVANSSCPSLTRASTPFFWVAKTWMAGTSLDKPGHDDAEGRVSRFSPIADRRG